MGMFHVSKQKTSYLQFKRKKAKDNGMSRGGIWGFVC